MTYNWDIDCLVQGREKVKKLYDEEKDMNEKAYYKLLLKHIDDFIKTKYRYTQVTNISINERFKEITEEIVEYSKHYELAKELMDIVHQSSKSISLIENRLENVIGDASTLSSLIKIRITKDHAMSLANKFYKGFSESLSPYFKQAYKQRYTSVIFSDCKDKNTDASSTYFDILDKYFINVGKSSEVPIVYSIIHEYGHILSRMVNPRSVLLDNNFMFDEVSSIFPELVAKYENIGDYDRILSLFDLYTDFINYTNMADSLALHIPLTNLWLDYDRKTCKRFFKEAREYYDCEKDKLEDILSSDIEDDGSYTTSFLVAIELFNMYKKNKEKALKLFDEIIHIPYNESVLDFVNNNMNLTEHLDEEVNTLIDQFGLELRKKGF